LGSEHIWSLQKKKKSNLLLFRCVCPAQIGDFKTTLGLRLLPQQTHVQDPLGKSKTFWASLSRQHTCADRNSSFSISVVCVKDLCGRGTTAQPCQLYRLVQTQTIGRSAIGKQQVSLKDRSFRAGKKKKEKRKKKEKENEEKMLLNFCFFFFDK
jgi:hypothetical protein